MRLVEKPEERPEEAPAGIRENVARLYRPEALDHYRRGRSDEGHPLEIEPHWTSDAVRVLLALAVAAILFGAYLWRSGVWR